MLEDNKVRVYAPIDVQQEIANSAREKAAVLAFPDEKQGDLQYIRSIMVSAGTNKNGAHFLPSEMMQAHNTIVNKAIDVEHEEEKVIGHIYDCAFMFKDGEQFDPNKVLADYQESAKDPDSLDIDICVAGVVHKMRFPDLAEEISEGLWKVSMECFFKDFDIKIGDNIITRDEAKALGYSPDDLIGGFVKVVAGRKALGKHFVSRVLRTITFSGMGIVKNPANPHSIIMETATHKELMERGEQVVNLEHVDNIRGHSINLSKNKEEASSEEGVSKVGVVSADGASVLDEQVFVEVDKVSGGIKRIITVEGKEAAAARWSGNGIPGPGSVTSYPDSICKSFKKRLTKFNALDQSEGQVIQEHWCALFEEPCPVIGASSKAPECLRNTKNRTTMDDSDNTLTKTIREHVNQGPGNTFTTVLSSPALSESAAGAAEKRREQIGRIKAEAEDLRNSLRSFVAAEKKTLE